MPWHVEKRGNKFVVVKNEGNEVVHMHNTREQAMKHVKALYANTNEGETK